MLIYTYYIYNGKRFNDVTSLGDNRIGVLFVNGFYS